MTRFKAYHVGSQMLIRDVVHGINLGWFDDKAQTGKRCKDLNNTKMFWSARKPDASAIYLKGFYQIEVYLTIKGRELKFSQLVFLGGERFPWHSLNSAVRSMTVEVSRAVLSGRFDG